MNLGLTGKTAIVTPATVGLGFVTTKALVEEDVNVATCSHSMTHKLARQVVDIPEGEYLMKQQHSPEQIVTKLWQIEMVTGEARPHYLLFIEAELVHIGSHANTSLRREVPA